MSVKIIIERKFKKAPVPENFQVINELRKSAIQQEGYVAGETLVNFEDNLVVVVSVWVSLNDWNNWLESLERAELEVELTPFLKEAVKIGMFIPAADYAKKTF